MSEPKDLGEGRRTLINSSSGERLDKVLANELADLSRSQCQRLIRSGLVTVDGKLGKASQRLSGGERIEVIIPEIVESEVSAEPIPLDIRYEDEDIVVINKPAGMVVHPSIGHESGTMVNALLAHCPDIAGIGGERRPGIVHRLDKDTSGLVVAAKNDRSLRFLQEQFKRREVKKIYLALVEGSMTPSEFKIDAPTGRDPRERKKMAVIPAGSSARSREAITFVSVVEHYGVENEECTLVSCRPVTGRTHQIRIHLAHAGYPIVGDRVYGHRKQRLLTARHFLHAAKLSIQRPSDRTNLTVQAPLPPELQSVLDTL
jgi:23S rRNA pseudouridine1911/1915/1917 synthase